MVHWIGNLLDIQDALPTYGTTAVLPVYELVNGSLIRTAAIAVEAFQAMMPGEVLAQYLPPDILPVQLGEFAFPFLRPPSRYAAIRISEDAALLSDGLKGDLVIVEMTGAIAAAKEPVLTPDRPFLRREDGKVEFRPYSQDAVDSVRRGDRGFVGIPRALIRRGTRDEQPGASCRWRSGPQDWT